jgi:hypothetical protein
MGWMAHVARMERRNVYKMLIGNPGGGRPLRERGYWLEVKNKIDFK